MHLGVLKECKFTTQHNTNKYSSLIVHFLKHTYTYISLLALLEAQHIHKTHILEFEMHTSHLFGDEVTAHLGLAPVGH